MVSLLGVGLCLLAPCWQWSPQASHETHPCGRIPPLRLLAKCPGIGKKTAERLVIELRDKLSPALLGTVTPSKFDAGTTPSAAGDNKVRDAVLALVALGYKAPDADKAVRQALVGLGPTASTEALIKKALG